MIKNDLPIGVFDSGIGGLNVLNYLCNNLKNESFVYLGDNNNAPYGNKSREELKKLSISCVKNLIDFKVKAIVIACNTLSTNCYKDIKDYSKLNVVGTYPTIVKDDNSVLFCTNKTASSSFVKDNFNDSCVYPLSSLAKKIEDSIYFNAPLNLQNLLPKLNKKPSAVILGCTHYIFLKDEFKRLFNCKVYDGLDGVLTSLNDAIKDIKSNFKSPKIYFISATASHNASVYKKVFCGCKSHKVVVVSQK